MTETATQQPFLCVFCGADQLSAKRLIAGRDRCAICDKCVLLCVEVLIGCETVTGHPKCKELPQ
jgi:ATP-dependent protease Clp ATPase subunit